MPFMRDPSRRARFARHWCQFVAWREAHEALRECDSVEAILGAGSSDLLRRTRLSFDPGRHQLRERFAEAIGTNVAELPRLHEAWPGFSPEANHIQDKAKLLAPLRDAAARARLQARPSPIVRLDSHLSRQAGTNTLAGGV